MGRSSKIKKISQIEIASKLQELIQNGDNSSIYFNHLLVQMPSKVQKHFS